MKVEIGDIVKMTHNPDDELDRFYYGVVVSFYEFGLFVQPRYDMKPLCFSWKANKIEVIKHAHGR